jgi:hypothetical protein
LFKIDNDMTLSAKRKSKKAAASSVTKGSRSRPDASGQQGVFKESEITKMSDKEFEENEKLIMEAQRKGKFIYDVTGSAR